METKNIAQAYASFYEKLHSKTSHEVYEIFFDAHSEFSDPFESVRGVSAIENIFHNMYAKLHRPRFVVDEVVSGEGVAYLKWHFYYSLNKGAKADSFTGVSRVSFSPSGKVKRHEDFWDAASNVYEKIPIIGTLLRFMKHRLEAS